jgi:hypothetical protein
VKEQSEAGPRVLLSVVVALGSLQWRMSARLTEHPLARMHTMTKRQGKSGTIDVKALLAQDEEFLRALVRTALQEVLEAEMTEVARGTAGCRYGRERR